MLISRPPESEYVAFYAGYVARVLDGDVFDFMGHQSARLRELLAGLTADQENFRFGPGEWSIKEMIGHVNDTERVFAYRALRVCRDDQTPVPGFDQDNYVRAANFGERTLSSLLEEYDLQRRANLLTFSNVSLEALLRCGNVNNSVMSARALVYCMAGHVEHHIESLKQDYLAKL